MYRLSTERMIMAPTKAGGFGVTTATPGQRVMCRIVDGEPLKELEKDPATPEIIGDASVARALPSTPPKEVVILAGIRSAKTTIAAAAAIRMALTVDLHFVKDTDTVRVPILSITKDKARACYTMIDEVVTNNRFIRSRLVGEPTAEAIRLRSLTTGHEVIISVMAGKKAGGSLVSEWVAGVVFDEAPRMNGSEDGVVNLDDSRKAVIGRVLPGGQILYVGSPWRASGPIYDMVQESWCHPSEDCVVLRGKGPTLNPYWWTPEHCDYIRRKEPDAYVTDVEADFGATESALINPRAVPVACRDMPIELPHDPKANYYAACDPSEGSASGNAWTLVIVSCVGDPKSPDGRRISVALARQYRGLDPEDIWKDIAGQCARYGLHRARTDQYAASSNRSLARRYGLHLEPEQLTGTEKVTAYDDVATLLHSGFLQLPPARDDDETTQGKTLQRDLLSIRKRKTPQGGYVIVLPKTGDGRHADFAPSLMGAVRDAQAPLTVRAGGPPRAVSRADNPRPVERMRRPV